MTPDKIRRIVAIIARGVALALLIILPLGFGAAGFRTAQQDVAFKAQLHAARLAKYAFEHGAFWEFHGSRITDLIAFAPRERSLHRQTVMTVKDRVVTAEDHALASPVFVHREPLTIAGQSIGTLVIETTLRPLAQDLLFVLMVAGGLAGLVLLGFNAFPLRLIDRMLHDLQGEQQRTSRALIDLAKTEGHLRERSAQLYEAQALGRIGDWSLTAGEKHLFLSPVVYELLRIDPEQFEPRRSVIAKLLLDDGAERAAKLIAAVAYSGQTGRLDLRFRRGDGSVADLAVTCRVTEVVDGQPYRYAGTVQDVSERVEAQRKLEQLAYFDPLTGLANRAMFQERLSREAAASAVSSAASALLLIDLDRFKEVNDTLGHAAGDELLVNVAQLLRRVIDPRHFIARLGGDEFAIILSGIDDVATVEALAQVVVSELSNPIHLSSVDVQIGASIGIALMPEHGSQAEDLNKNADLALYRAKDDGRSRAVVFDPQMNAELQNKMALARDLRAAAAGNDGLEVWFQPQVDLKSDMVVGFEALMRWHHPTRGTVPPSEFIPIAESSSLICDLGLWILRETVLIAKRWIDAGGMPFEVAVNLSAAQIWQTNIEEDVAKILSETGLPPHLLCLELTESMLADHAEGRVRSTLRALKGLGIKLALDDFGTGYSSLGYLIQLPFDKLKVDRVFVAEAARSEKGRHVLRGIIALGHGLGMKVVAEGVENLNELEHVACFGCDEIQGYLISKPAPAAAALAFVVKSMLVKGQGGALGPVASVLGLNSRAA